MKNLCKDSNWNILFNNFMYSYYFIVLDWKSFRFLLILMEYFDGLNRGYKVFSLI